MTLTEYRAALADVQTAIDNCVATGEQYSVVGSHSKRQSLAELRNLRSYYRKKILRMSGYRIGRTTPDFSQ